MHVIIEQYIIYNVVYNAHMIIFIFLYLIIKMLFSLADY